MIHRERHQLTCGPYTLRFGERTHIMGVLNITPDSFSGDGIMAMAGSRVVDDQVVELAVARAHQMVEDGADILDVGGESTRPGSEPVPMEEELRRVLPVVGRLARDLNVPVSVDTYKAEVAREAIEAGAHMVNDISALRFSSEMAVVVARAGVPVVLMHTHGTIKGWDHARTNTDVMPAILAFFRERLTAAAEGGIQEEKIIIDPGFGFGKTLDQNLDILRRLGEMRALGRPILIGTSRKATIGKVLSLPVDDLVEGTAATVALAIARGADIIRVHDVKAMVRVARMADAIVRG